MDNLKAIFRFKNTGFNNKELKSSADYLLKGIIRSPTDRFPKGTNYTLYVFHH